MPCIFPEPSFHCRPDLLPPDQRSPTDVAKSIATTWAPRRTLLSVAFARAADDVFSADVNDEARWRRRCARSLRSPTPRRVHPPIAQAARVDFPQRGHVNMGFLLVCDGPTGPRPSFRAVARPCPVPSSWVLLGLVGLPRDLSLGRMEAHRFLAWAPYDWGSLPGFLARVPRRCPGPSVSGSPALPGFLARGPSLGFAQTPCFGSLVLLGSAEKRKSMRTNAKQRRATPSNAKQCQAVRSIARQRQATPSNATQRRATQSNAKMCQALIRLEVHWKTECP